MEATLNARTAKAGARASGRLERPAYRQSGPGCVTWRWWPGSPPNALILSRWLPGPAAELPED